MNKEFDPSVPFWQQPAAQGDAAIAARVATLDTFPAAPRAFGRREVSTFKAHTDEEIIKYAPCVFDPDKVDHAKQYDVFVADASNLLVTGWHNVSTEECAEWALTLQNMIRDQRPWLRVKVWSKPRYHA